MLCAGLPPPHSSRPKVSRIVIGAKKNRRRPAVRRSAGSGDPRTTEARWYLERNSVGVPIAWVNCD